MRRVTFVPAGPRMYSTILSSFGRLSARALFRPAENSLASTTALSALSIQGESRCEKPSALATIRSPAAVQSPAFPRISAET